VPNGNVQLSWNVASRGNNNHQQTVEQIWQPAAQITKNNELNTTETKYKLDRCLSAAMA